MEEYDLRFQRGHSHLFVGPSGSGKTFRVADILRLKNDVFQNGHEIKNVVFFYAVDQPIYNELRKEGVVTTWINKKPTNELFIEQVSEHKNSGGSIVIIDDFMSDISKDFVEIITVTSRHFNTSTMMLFQCLFPSNPLARQISLNVKYVHIHKNPRENAQIQYFARQLQPSNYKWIVESYHAATEKPYSCFSIDLNQNTKEEARFLSNFLPHEWPICAWLSKKSIF